MALNKIGFRIHSIHVVHILLFLLETVTLQSQQATQTEILTPTNPKANGATVNTHMSEVSIINNVWNAEILSQSSWQFIIILDNSWGFDPFSFSSIKLTLDSPNTIITDDIVLGFSANNAEYFSVSIPMTTSSDTNQIYPNCLSSTNPTQTYAVGDIASIPDFDRNCDVAGGSCLNWRTILPSTTESNQFPFTITLENTPATNSMFVKTATTSTHVQSCGFVSFLANRGLKIYIGGNDAFHTFQISSFTIESYAESRAPTNSPTTAAPTATPSAAPSLTPTDSPTSAPSNAPTESPTNAPSNPPSFAPTIAPSSAPSHSPTDSPSLAPTKAPSSAPIAAPTNAPSLSPVAAPTNAPSVTPTNAPTDIPTSTPSAAPTQPPTAAPTDDPTMDPTRDPTSDPTHDPTKEPTMIPTNYPSKEPTTHVPTTPPTTHIPTVQPTTDPTDDPSTDPTMDPTLNPIVTTEDPIDLAQNAVSESNVGVIVAVCILSLVVLGLLKVGYDHYIKKRKRKWSEGDKILHAIGGSPMVEVEGAPIDSYIVTVCFIGKTFHYQLPKDTGADNRWDDSTFNKLIHVVGNEFNLHRKFALSEHMDGVKLNVDCIDDIITSFESSGKRQIILYVEVEHLSSMSSRPTPGKNVYRVASTSLYQSKSSATRRAKYTMSLNMDAPTSDDESHSSESSQDMIIKKTRQ